MLVASCTAACYTKHMRFLPGTRRPKKYIIHVYLFSGKHIPIVRYTQTEVDVYVKKEYREPDVKKIEVEEVW